MPTTVGDFYNDVRTALARGTSLDTNLEPWARQALRMLEREISFDYMKDTFFLLTNPGAKSFDFSDDIPLIRSVDSLGYFAQDGGEIPLTKINRQSVGTFANTIPDGYYREKNSLFFVGAVNPPGYTGEVSYPLLLRVSQFTEWPTDAGDSHPILDFADDLLKYQIMYQNATALRSQEQIVGWKTLRDEAIHSVRALQDESERETDVSIEYRGGNGRLYPSSSACIAAIQGMFDVPDEFGVAGLYHVGT